MREQHNMYRVGIVKSQDASNGCVRVSFPDRDQMTSWWLPVVFSKTQDDKSFWMPDIGEQVVCMMDEFDEDGAVLGAIYSSVDRPPAANPDKLQWKFKDNAVFEYDRAAHSLQITIPPDGTVNISASGASLTIDGSGNVILGTPGELRLAGGGPGIARIGDETTCPAGSGYITSGSTKVKAG
jgi:phage baseplate assembly protein V